MGEITKSYVTGLLMSPSSIQWSAMLGMSLPRFQKRETIKGFIIYYSIKVYRRYKMFKSEFVKMEML